MRRPRIFSNVSKLTSNPPNHEQNGSSRLFGLDLLRAVAILLVLLAHTLPGGTTFPIIKPIAATFGYFGVELFFVLSGFLIGGILIRMMQRGELRTVSGVVEFWKRRWYRTLPNYVLFLVFNVIWAVWIERASLTSFWHYLIFTQNLAWPCPVFFQESWSLAVEEWFYLIFPIIVVAVTGWNRRPHFFGVALMIMLLVPLGLRCLGWVEDSWDESIRKVVIYRLDSMMLGVAAAYLAVTNEGWWKKIERIWPFGILMLLGVAAYLLRFQPLSTSEWIHRAPLTFLTSLGVALLIPALVKLKTAHVTTVRVVRNISLWSYSLYLCHTPVIRGLRYFCTEIIPFSLYQNPLIRFVLIWAIAFSIAALVYRWWEKPMTQLRDR